MAKLNPELIVELEGCKYTKIVGDYGGGTKYGITERTYPNEDIKNLTLQKATEIYNRDYWKPYCLDNVYSSAVADKLFSILINFSPNRAVDLIQSSVISCGKNIAKDGIIGACTIDAINSLNPNLLLQKLREGMVQYYTNRVKIDSTQSKFLEGWLCRATK